MEAAKLKASDPNALGLNALGLNALGRAVKQKPGSSGAVSPDAQAFSKMLSLARDRASSAERSSGQEAGQGMVTNVEFGQVQREIVNYLNDWRGVSQEIQDKVQGLPRQMKDLVELQMHVHTLQLQTNLATKAGETVSSTVRRVQQMGAG